MAASRVEHALVHVDVDDLGAVLDLLARDVERGLVVAVQDQARELGRAGDVGALADVDEDARPRSMFSGSRPRQAGQASAALRDRRAARRRATASAMAADVVGRGAAAAADDVDASRCSANSRDLRGHVVRRLVVLAELVGQAGVGVGADIGIGDPRQLLDVRPQLVGAQGAVEPDGQRLGVAQRVPEGLGGLAGQGAADGVGDGAGDHHRQRARRARRTLARWRRARPWRSGCRRWSRPAAGRRRRRSGRAAASR